MTQPQPDVLTIRWYAQPDDLIGGWCVTADPRPPSAGAAEIASFTGRNVAEHVAHLHNMWLLGDPPPGPVQQLRNVAEHDVGLNAPYLADLIIAAAEQLEEEMAGPPAPLAELIAVRRDDVDRILHLLVLVGAAGLNDTRQRLTTAVEDHGL